MITTTSPSVLPFSKPRLSFLVRAALVILFWAVAAGMVTGAHVALAPISVAASVAVKIAAILVTAWLYVRLTARECTVDQALIVGTVWLLLDIGAEIATTTYLGRTWSDLIGSPASPALRDLLLFTWIGAPAMFARYSNA